MEIFGILPVALKLSQPSAVAEKAELGLAELSALLQAQIHGEGGPLLTDGWANVFFIKDANESLCEMHAIWGSLKIGDLGMGRNSPGWRLLAHPEERYSRPEFFFAVEKEVDVR